MTWFEMQSAVDEAKETIRIAESQAASLAKLLAGLNLRSIKNYNDAEALIKLKRQLRDFNIHTRQWRP